MHEYLTKQGHETAIASKEAANEQRAAVGDSSSVEGITAWQYQMHGHAERCVQKYCELAGVQENSLKKCLTPNLDDHQLQPEDFENQGK